MSRVHRLLVLALVVVPVWLSVPSARAQCWVCGTTGCLTFSWGRTSCYQWQQGGILHCGTDGASCAIASTILGCADRPDPNPGVAASSTAGPDRMLPCGTSARPELLVNAWVFRIGGGMPGGGMPGGGDGRAADVPPLAPVTGVATERPALAAPCVGTLTASGDLSVPLRIETGGHEGFALTAEPAGEAVRVEIRRYGAGGSQAAESRLVGPDVPSTFSFVTREGRYLAIVRAWSARDAAGVTRLEAIRARIASAASLSPAAASTLRLVPPDADTPAPGHTWGELKMIYR